MNKEQEQHNFWNKEFDTVEPTSINPVRITDNSFETYSEIVEHELKALKLLDPHIHSQVIKGQLMCKNRVLTDDNHVAVLHTIIKCIFQCMRDDINDRGDPLEDRQAELIKISSAESVFLAGLQVLEPLKIKLDINSVYAIIHGYIGQCVNTAITNYEHTRSIKH
jgi:hypothetical protein